MTAATAQSEVTFYSFCEKGAGHSWTTASFTPEFVNFTCDRCGAALQAANRTKPLFTGLSWEQPRPSKSPVMPALN